MSAAFSNNPSGNDLFDQEQTSPRLTLFISKNLPTTAKEILLTKEESEIQAASANPKLRQWLNIYPYEGLIAVGDTYNNYPTHDRVDEGLSKLLGLKECLSSEYNLSDPVAGFRDGNIYIVRIDGLRDEIFEDYSLGDFQKSSRAAERINQQLVRYEKAMQIATQVAEKSGGKVIIQADFESQKLIAKILGRLHQVDRDYLSVGPEGLRKKMQSFAGIQHIYDNNKGTRYFFLDDLKTFAHSISSSSSREDVQRTLSELSHFLTDRNPRGFRHGKPFLFEPNGKQPVLNDRVYLDFAKEVEKARQLASRSTDFNWSTVRSSVSSALLKPIEALKESYPKFNSINLDSSDFVSAFYSVLQRGGSKTDLGEEFSTPLNAIEFGKFRLQQNGGREFEILTSNNDLAKITAWLLSEQGMDDLVKLGAKIKPSEADYITCYTPDTPLTFEPHPTEFVKRFGHLEPRSYVIEFGQAGKTQERWVIEENVWSSENWLKRPTKTVRKLLQQFSPAELSIAVKRFKDEQQRLFSALLNDSTAGLAEEYQWRTIPYPPESFESFNNYRVRRFVPGKRADDIQMDKMDSFKLARVMEPLGQLMAAGIIAQLPHLPLRDTILNTTSNGTGILTLLGPGESFCHSHREKRVPEYLNDFVPQMYGNLLAQWLLPVSRITSGFDDKIRKRTRVALIDQCLKSMRHRLMSTASDSTQIGRNFRELLAQIYDNHQRSRDEGYLLKQLKITTFLPFTEKMLKLDKGDILQISDRIGRATMKELALIDRLAPPPTDTASIDQWLAVEECSTAASSLIERHLPEAKKFRVTIDRLKDISTEYNLLTVRERAWYISLLDVDTRARELGKRNVLAQLVKKAVSESANELDFYGRYKAIGQDLDLSYESVVAYYRAVLGLRASLQTEGQKSHSSKRCSQLKMAIASLR